MIGLLLFSLPYLKYVDYPRDGRIKMWKKALQDYGKRPLVGWGLDSFRSVTPWKDFKYYGSVSDKGNDAMSKYIQWWDNPHSLPVSLLYEFSIVGFIIFCGFVYDKFERFKNARKTVNSVTLMGMFIVFLVLSIGHFPIFLVRLAVIVVPATALLEVNCNG